MLDAQRALGDAEEENRQLKRTFEEMQRVSDFGKAFTFSEGVYWHREYPYCPNCSDAGHKPTRLNGPYRIANTPSGYKAREWICPLHSSIYHLSKGPDAV